MNGLPYYKAYPRDFIEGTVGMPFEVKGAYRMLLDIIYMRAGDLPDDPRYIAGILGCSVRAWNGYRAALIDAGKIVIADGLISNFRADKELIILRSFQERQSENRTKPNKNKGLESPRSNHTEPDTDTEKKKEDDAAGAAAPSGRYAFEATTIKLSAPHLEEWRKAYPSLRLEAELFALDEWARTKGKGWFSAVSSALKNKQIAADERTAERKERLRLEATKPPSRPAPDPRI